MTLEFAVPIPIDAHKEKEEEPPSLTPLEEVVVAEHSPYALPDVPQTEDTFEEESNPYTGSQGGDELRVDEEPQFTPILSETYALLQQGYAPVQIAEILQISLTNAQQRVSRVTRQLGISFSKDIKKPSDLTPAEKRIAALHSEGLNLHEQAEQLQIRPDTVHTYRSRIRKKTGFDFYKTDPPAATDSFSLLPTVSSADATTAPDTVVFYDDGKTIMYNDQVLELRPKEHGLLKLLMQHPKGIHKIDIASRLGIISNNIPNAVEACKARLLKSLAGRPELAAAIKTVGNTGFIRLDNEILSDKPVSSSSSQQIIELGSLKVDANTREILQSGKILGRLELKFLEAVSHNWQGPTSEAEIMESMCDQSEETMVPNISALAYEVSKKLQSCSPYRIKKVGTDYLICEQ